MQRKPKFDAFSAEDRLAAMERSKKKASRLIRSLHEMVWRLIQVSSAYELEEVIDDDIGRHCVFLGKNSEHAPQVINLPKGASAHWSDSTYDNYRRYTVTIPNTKSWVKNELARVLGRDVPDVLVEVFASHIDQSNKDIKKFTDDLFLNTASIDELNKRFGDPESE